jgi:hypothetical protein
VNSQEENVDEELAKKITAKYTDEICPICNSRIDEFGFCACGAGSE